MAIDHHGRLQEVGWLLYPSMQFLAWQAQWYEYIAVLYYAIELLQLLTKVSDTYVHDWLPTGSRFWHLRTCRFDYEARLEANLSRASLVLTVFDDVIMHGAEGVSRTLSFPPYQGSWLFIHTTQNTQWGTVILYTNDHHLKASTVAYLSACSILL